MKNVNLRLCWYFFVFILIVGSILYWINVKQNTSNTSINIKEASIEQLSKTTKENKEKTSKNDDIKQDPILTPEEEKILKIKTNFNTSCTQITSNEKIKELLNDWKIILDENIKMKIYSYIDNNINLNELENIILEQIWEIDWSESWEQRLYLNYIFLVLNDIRRWNSTDCTKIFTQYYK